MTDKYLIQSYLIKNLLDTVEKDNPGIWTNPEFKRYILKSMLIDIKNDIKNSHIKHVIDLIRVLKKKNINWPELTTIEKNVQSRDVVIEDEEKNLDDATEAEKLRSVKNHWANITYISNPSKAVQIAAVEQDAKALEYIIEDGIVPSEEVQLAAVIAHATAMRYIVDAGFIPSEQVQLESIKNNSLTLRYIIRVTKPSLQIQLTALEDEPWLVKYLDKVLHPEILKMPNFKRAILKELIESIKNNELNHATNILKVLKQNNAKWPELDILVKKLKDKNVAIPVTENNKQQSEEDEFKSLSHDEQIKKIKDNGYFIRYIKNPSEELQLAAVKSDGDWGIYGIMEKGIKPSEAVQLAAVQQNGAAIHRILEKGYIPSEEIQLASIKQFNRAIKYILEHIEPSFEVKLFAIQRDPRSVMFFDKDDPFLKNKVAKRHMLDTILYNIKSGYHYYAMGLLTLLKNIEIDWPELAVIEKNIRRKDEVMESSPFSDLDIEKNLRKLDDDERFAAIKEYVFGIRYYDNDLITPQIKRYVLMQLMDFIKRTDKWYARELFKILLDKKLDWPELDTIAKTLKAKKIIYESNINTASEEEQIHDVVYEPELIFHIKNPSEAVQLAAVSNDGDVLQFIKNPSETVQLAAVKNNGYAIQYIKNPSEAVQLTAINDDPYTIRYIKNPSETIQLAALENSVWVIEYFTNITPLVKRTVLKILIDYIRRNKNAADLYVILRDMVDWPELDIIKKTLKVKNII